MASRCPAAWLCVGFVLGVVAASLIGSGIWPHAPLHAVATDRYENFAIATGPIDNDVEAVFFLDFLTGDLKAAILSPQFGRFNAFYEKNILEDMGIDVTKNPHYLMVTGIAALRRAGGMTARPGASVVYVAELTTGKVAAYAVPWRPDIHNLGTPFRGTLIPLDIAQFRTTAVREQ